MGACVAGLVLLGGAAAWGADPPERGPDAVRRPAEVASPSLGAAADQRSAADPRPMRPGPWALLRFELALDENPFRPAPQDHAPVTEQEEPALLEVARGLFPRAAALLSDLRQREPEQYRQRLRELAPFLRLLSRRAREMPAVAGLLVRHADNERLMHRLHLAYHRSPPDWPERGYIAEELRRLAEENTEIEQQACEAWLAHLQASQAQRVEMFVQRLLEFARSGDDMLAVPPDIRRFVDHWRSATSDEQRRRIENRMRAVTAARVAERIERMGQRLELAARNRQQRVEQRVQRLLSEPPGEGGPPRPRERR